MMLPTTHGLLAIELAITLALLLWADRWLHRHLQGLMLLLTGDEELALWLYAIVLFPGVVLHELSHALMARLVGTRIGRIHVLPRRVGKRIQLGYVPVESTDFLRASFIGIAPFLVGSCAIVAIGYLVFGTPEVLQALAQGDWSGGAQAVASMTLTPDGWLWAYLVFAISNTMLPSRSDLHAWPALLMVIAIAILVTVWAGGAELIREGSGRFLSMASRWIVLFGASALLIDLPFFTLILVSQKALEQLKGVRLTYD